jgi:hypothetical protein
MKQPKVCQNSLCKVDYPHSHTRPEGGNPNWRPTIDDPIISARWPERLQWKRSDLRKYQNRLFQFGWFSTHNKLLLPWKFDTDSLCKEDWSDIAKIITWKFAFRSVYGVPKRGTALAQALNEYATPGYPVLIVDDVLTTGNSIREARSRLGLDGEPVIGVVVAARGPCPDWVWPILQISEWSQSRATGLG